VRIVRKSRKVSYKPYKKLPVEGNQTLDKFAVKKIELIPKKQPEVKLVPKKPEE
jgi:hypothetical protein